MKILSRLTFLISCSICMHVLIADGLQQYCPSTTDGATFNIQATTSCYHLIEKTSRNTGYQSAEDDCNTRHGHLLTIKNKLTNDQLSETISNISDSHTVLLGIRTVNSKWIWSTGVEAQYANWADPAQPGNCATLQLQMNGTWHRVDCATENWYTVYICEHKTKHDEKHGSGTDNVKYSTITVLSTIVMTGLCMWLQ